MGGSGVRFPEVQRGQEVAESEQRLSRGCLVGMEGPGGDDSGRRGQATLGTSPGHEEAEKSIAEGLQQTLP